MRRVVLAAAVGALVFVPVGTVTVLVIFLGGILTGPSRILGGLAYSFSDSAPDTLNECYRTVRPAPTPRLVYLLRLIRLERRRLVRIPLLRGGKGLGFGGMLDSTVRLSWRTAMRPGC